MTEIILNTTTDTLETTSAREIILNVGTATKQLEARQSLECRKRTSCEYW